MLRKWLGERNSRTFPSHLSFHIKRFGDRQPDAISIRYHATRAERNPQYFFGVQVCTGKHNVASHHRRPRLHSRGLVGTPKCDVKPLTADRVWHMPMVVFFVFPFYTLLQFYLWVPPSLCHRLHGAICNTSIFRHSSQLGFGDEHRVQRSSTQELVAWTLRRSGPPGMIQLKLTNA
jgi:hypothetical protein